jgi:hypothetical protein
MAMAFRNRSWNPAGVVRWNKLLTFAATVLISLEIF